RIGSVSCAGRAAEGRPSNLVDELAGRALAVRTGEGSDRIHLQPEPQRATSPASVVDPPRRGLRSAVVEDGYSRKPIIGRDGYRWCHGQGGGVARAAEIEGDRHSPPD